MSDEQHCFCQSKDTDRFMIGCDECNKWFHGDCVNVTEQNAKSIVHFYCPPCMQANSRLSIVSKESLAAARKASMATGASSASQPKAVESSAPSTGCGQCIGCFRTTDCGKCDGCKGGQRCKGRICVNTDVPSMKKPKKISAPVGRPPKSKQLQMKKTPPKQNKGGRQPLKGGKANGAAGRGTRSSIQAYQQFMKEAGMISSDEDEKGGRQCFGLKCTQAARKGSKYCSDECGLALAKARLCAFLPARVASYWGTTPQAEVMQKSQLEDVRDRQRKARDRLAQLDDEVRSLDDWVEVRSHHFSH
uniref:CXXC-type zinc finger protein 1 n=1 Tax=Plectus sambesii TaxID=2011161 RepID=A0A914UMR5_9BILA